MIKQFIQVILLRLRGINHYNNISSDILSTFTRAQQQLDLLDKKLDDEQTKRNKIIEDTKKRNF